jgi:predicted ATPase
MLIEFSVKNFKSIRDEQTLSLVASNYYAESKEALIDIKLPGLARTSYLPCAVVFGANASGKSTLICALAMLRRMVLEAFNQNPGQALVYAPFALDTGSRNAATELNIVFTADGVRYAYALSYCANSVLRESLAAYPKGKEQLWFERYYDTDNRIMVCKPNNRYLKVPADIFDILRDDVPLISLMIKLNYESMRPVAKWFTEGLAVLDRSPEIPQDILRRYSTNLLKGTVGKPEMRTTMMNMITRADFGILDGQVVPAPAPVIPEEIMRALPEELFGNLSDVEWETVQFAHQGKEATQLFGFDDESAGTRRLFELAGPIADALESGKTVVIDELDSSMHPLLVNEIVRLFQSPITNTSGAQLICTVHSTSTMEKGLLRRDQIWFTRKKRGGNSELYPLSDYKPRKDESVEASYLTGRYDAIPVIPELFGYRWGESG